MNIKVLNIYSVAWINIQKCKQFWQALKEEATRLTPTNPDLLEEEKSCPSRLAFFVYKKSCP